jgi:hypothetical protein
MRKATYFRHMTEFLLILLVIGAVYYTRRIQALERRVGELESRRAPKRAEAPARAPAPTPVPPLT